MSTGGCGARVEVMRTLRLSTVAAFEGPPLSWRLLILV